MIFDIIIIVIVIAQFIYLLNRINNMAVLDDLKTAITELDASVDSIITKLQDLKTQLEGSVLAADLEDVVAKLQTIKTKVDAAKQ